MGGYGLQAEIQIILIMPIETETNPAQAAEFKAKETPRATPKLINEAWIMSGEEKTAKDEVKSARLALTKENLTEDDEKALRAMLAEDKQIATLELAQMNDQEYEAELKRRAGLCEIENSELCAKRLTVLKGLSNILRNHDSRALPMLDGAYQKNDAGVETSIKTFIDTWKNRKANPEAYSELMRDLKEIERHALKRFHIRNIVETGAREKEAEDADKQDEELRVVRYSALKEKIKEKKPADPEDVVELEKRINALKNPLLREAIKNLQLDELASLEEEIDELAEIDALLETIKPGEGEDENSAQEKIKPEKLAELEQALAEALSAHQAELAPEAAETMHKLGFDFVSYPVDKFDKKTDDEDKTTGIKHVLFLNPNADENQENKTLLEANKNTPYTKTEAEFKIALTKALENYPARIKSIIKNLGNGKWSAASPEEAAEILRHLWNQDKDQEEKRAYAMFIKRNSPGISNLMAVNAQTGQSFPRSRDESTAIEYSDGTKFFASPVLGFTVKK